MHFSFVAPNQPPLFFCTHSGELCKALGNLMSLTVLNVSYNQLSGFLTPVPSGSVFATESVLCCAGPPLPEALKLLAPLANLEELSLGGNALCGTITADVEVFTKLKKLDLHGMGLDGKRLSTRSERLRMLLTFMFCCYRTPAS